MPPVQYYSQAMDHLGLAAGMCKEPGITDYIDKHAPNSHERKIPFSSPRVMKKVFS